MVYSAGRGKGLAGEKQICSFPERRKVTEWEQFIRLWKDRVSAEAARNKISFVNFADPVSVRWTAEPLFGLSVTCPVTRKQCPAEFRCGVC